MTDFCEYIYCKGEFIQPLIIYEKLDFKKLTREKIPIESKGNLNTYIINTEIQISRCFGVYNIYTYIFTYIYTYIYPPGHHKLCDASSAGDIAKIVAHL